MPGSIETRSAASGWKLGASVNTKRAMLRLVGSVEVARPARADAPAVDHGHPPAGARDRGLVRVADQEDDLMVRRCVLEDRGVLPAISAGSCTMTRSTLPISGVGQPVNLSTSAGSGLAS